MTLMTRVLCEGCREERVTVVWGRSALCEVCSRAAEDLDQGWHNRLREKHGARLLGHREMRLEAESGAAPAAGDAGRRSRLMAMLPRLDAGLAAVPDGVCEASDFPTVLCGLSLRQKLATAAAVTAGLGLACGAGFLMLLGARVAVGWLLDWSA